MLTGRSGRASSCSYRKHVHVSEYHPVQLVELVNTRTCAIMQPAPPFPMRHGTPSLSVARKCGAICKGGKPLIWILYRFGQPVATRAMSVKHESHTMVLGSSVRPQHQIEDTFPDCSRCRCRCTLVTMQRSTTMILQLNNKAYWFM